MVLKLLGEIPFRWSFWIRVFMYVCLFQASVHFDCQPHVDVNGFLEPVFMNFLIAWRFPILYFFCVALCESRCIFALGLSLSSWNSFFILFIHSVLMFCLLPSYILLVFFPSHPVIGMTSLIPPLLAGRIFFRCFGMSCFVCLVWSCLDIFVVFFLPPVTLGLFPRFILFILLASIFLFFSNIIQRFPFVLSFSFFIDFLSVYSV